MTRRGGRADREARAGAVPGHGAVPGLTLDNVTKYFGAKRAVQGVSLDVQPGTFVVLLGPSGSGKSTLLRCLAGIEAPTSGTITLGSAVVDGPGVHQPPERRNLSMVFQDYALWPHLTAEQNVAFALRRRRLENGERCRRARAMLDQVGLAGLAERYPGQLSGGEQQRVALARALVAEPGLLLFDEPLSNLDADRREQLRIDIGAMVRRHGATAVYITHDQAEAFALADRVGVLDQGRLVQFDTPEAVYERPATEFVARFTGLAGELDATCVGSDGTTAVLQVGQDRVSGRLLSGRRVAHGQRVRLLIRPSGVRLARPDARTGTVTGITGVVRDSAFRGWGYEHAVEVAGGQLLAGVAAPVRLPTAERVDLELLEAGCLVTPVGEAPAGRPHETAGPPDGRGPTHRYDEEIELPGTTDRPDRMPEGCDGEVAFTEPRSGAGRDAGSPGAHVGAGPIR
jgi:iron(III) transport system ATP-binding protein